MAKKQTRRTKAEVFIDDHFEVSEQDNVFTFTPKDGSGFTDVATIEGVESKKSACIALHDALNSSKAEPRMTLMDIAEKYPTDKIDHGYIPLYWKHLEAPTKSLLEIGCYKGNSVRMWREFFPEETKVATLDLFIEHPVPDIHGVDFFKGDQKDVELLEFIAANDFDVVIDDGSHGAKDQWLVLNTFVRPGTLVVIEDLHCNAESGGFWNQGLPFEQTILGKIKSGSFPYKHELYLDKIVFVWG